MPRVLLLLPTTTYRTHDFLEAARRLKVEVVVASERSSTLEEQHPGGLLTLNFIAPEEAAYRAAEFYKDYPFQAVVPVDEETAVAAAAIARAVGLPHNSLESAMAARDKHRMREALSRSGVPVPGYALVSLDEEPEKVAGRIRYPCVVKPLFLSASRGVIRASDQQEFRSAFRRLEAILGEPELVRRGGPLARKFLVEDFVSGQEVALEGLLTRGDLRVLAIFDKPDPLEGPFFEETIYVTPSRLPETVQSEIARCAAQAAKALGLREGPIHAELRFNAEGTWLIELAARSIGGLCARTLRFGAGLSLEELILRHALGMEIEGLARERRPAGVMMIPIPGAGILEEVRGQAEARAVAGVEEVTISAHLGKTLVPLPEGSGYLGFIFARAGSPEEVEQALRQAHRRLEFVIQPTEPAG